MRVHSYGNSGPLVIVLHGGPAAVGEAAPIARGLADSFRALEPWQRGSGDKPLTVAMHIADLHTLIESRCPDQRPAIVGESWGAMLALAFAAEYPGSAGPIVLVGCGTFDKASRARMRQILDERTDGELRQLLERLEVEISDPDARLKARYELMESLYMYDPVIDQAEQDGEAAAVAFDMLAHAETWTDMVRLQDANVYPVALEAIESPVLMLHGSHDPHPGEMIRASLQPHIPQIEYHQLERCGHSPWREKAARRKFFETLRNWLTSHNIG